MNNEGVNSNNKFYNFQQFIRQNPIIAGAFALLQVIFLIVLVAIVSGLNLNNYSVPSMPISSLESDLKVLPKNSVETIQSSLYDIVTLNGKTLPSISESDTQIREGTLKDLYFDKINMHYVSFIVDIPSIEQSYQIFNEWSDDAANPNSLINMETMAMCPLKSQEDYSNFDCQDKYNHKGQSLLASSFLSLLDSGSFKTFLQNDKAPYVIIIAPNTFGIDDDTKNSFIEQTKENIMSLGFSSDAFEYYVSYGPEDPDVFLDYIISKQ